ncbi:MAG: hypothetical protein ACI4F4_07275 [Lachnospiraceae bacterium]
MKMDIQTILMGFIGASNYLCGFYGLYKIRFRRKFIPLHICLSTIVACVLVYMDLRVDIPILYVYGSCLELLLTWGTIYLLADGDFFRNYFQIVIWSWSVNIIVCSMYMILDYDFFYKAFIQMEYHDANPWKLLGYLICPFLVIPIFKKLIQKFPKNRPIWNLFYKFTTIYMLITSFIKMTLHCIEKEGMKLITVSQLTLAFLLLLLLVVLFIFERVRQLKIRREIIAKEYEVLQRRYESAVDLTKNYRLLRHEWNHQLALQKGAKNHVSVEERKKYLGKYENSMNDFMQIPFSGNMHVDMELYYFKKLCKENNVMVDMVVSPFTASKGFGIPVAYILQECVTYVEKLITVKKRKPLWIHLDVRCVGWQLLLQMEMELMEKEKRMQRFGHAFFSGESVADFGKVNQIIEDWNGDFNLSVKETNYRILAMLSIPKNEEE